MNLVTGDWIPVVFQDNRGERLGLRRLFGEAEDIRDLAATPPQRIALMRLLICIVQAALDGPADRSEWEACRPRIQAKALAYLDAHRHQFELYGDNPFMQVSTLEHTFNATLDKLDFGLSAGNNATLYDHAATAEGRPHDDGWLALMLISYLVFSPGGLIGVTKWNDIVTGKTSEHAPGVECSALHTYVRAGNLLDTLHANLLTKEQIRAIANLRWGKPTWEIDRRHRDAAELKSSVMTYLGRLLPLTRAVRLERGATSLTLVNGLEYPKFPECREVTATVVERKDGKLTYVPTSLDRHPWRELNALLSHGTRNGAFALNNLGGSTGTVDIWTGGLAADKGKILDTAEWTFAVPAGMVGNGGTLGKYRKGVELAESAEKILYGAVKTYADAMKLEPAPMPKARVAFWSRLDQSCEVLLETANDSSMRFEDTWLPLLKKSANLAYAHACPHATPRQIQAFAQARRRLNLNKLSSDPGTAENKEKQPHE